jgi:iron(III) transport system substrate-binding protein
VPPTPSRLRRRAGVVLLAGALPALLAACGVSTADHDADTLRVFSARTYGAEQAYAQFTEDTGIEVSFLNGSDAELRERLQLEGADTQADVFMTTDVANLSLAAEQGLFTPLESPELEAAVPASLRDPQDRWFALSVRARALLHNTAAVQPEELTSYEALGDPKWKGRLCLRGASSSYTQSLVASFLAHEGPERARQIVDAWVANEPQIFNNDNEVVRTIAEGGCDVGITNHYYLARELSEDPDFPVGLVWPEQPHGVHVNISGAGVTTHADNPEQARTFLEWLATKGQSLFVDGNFEYPVNQDVEPTEQLQELGDFQPDALNVAELAVHNAQAVQIMTEAGYR